MDSRKSTEDPPLLPTSTYPPSSPYARGKRRQSLFTATRRRLLLYVAAFAISAFGIHHFFGGTWTTAPSWAPPALDKTRPIFVDWEADLGDGHAPVGGVPCAPVPGLPVIQVPEPVWPLDRVRKMVEKSKGYYARDYSLWLGWNNIRYIIEAGLVHAQLLNRTLIVPSFVYARGCEFELNACGAFLEMVNRGDAIDWNEWREWPIEKQMGWKVPIEMMIDMAHLRETHAVVTMSEYLRLHSLPPTLEKGNGQWDDTTYRTTAHTISNWEWDPSGTVRVDHIPPAYNAQAQDEDAVRAQSAAADIRRMLEPSIQANDKSVLDWDLVKSQLSATSVDVRKDADLERALRAAGFEVLHTFRGARGSDLIKSVVEPLKQIAARSSLHGVIDDYGSSTSEVVYLEGETHLGRKPGNVRFTSMSAMESFARTVLYSLRPLPEISLLAERVDQRMRERTNGRLWRAAHMRRGDFVTYQWTENNLENHVRMIKEKLRHGPDVWREIRQNHEAQTFDVPDVKLNRAMFDGELPRQDDPFYIATDERDPVGMDYIRSQGGLLIGDLLTPEDRAIVGWPLLITDILGLVEQQALSRAAYFYGFGASSVAGGVLNLRAMHGWDPRTTVVD